MLPEQVNPSNENDAATAPYNFVPLNERAVTAPSECLPDQDVYHSDRYTGTIRCQLTTKTPTFVRAPLTLDDEYRRAETDADKALSYDQRVKNKPDFFYTDADKTPRIPGSSLRGMLRTLVEIAGYGRFISVTRRSLIYRAVGDVTSHGNNYRDQIMRANAGVRGPQAYTPRVLAGYIKHEGEEWRLWPAQEAVPGTTFGRIDDRHWKRIYRHLPDAPGYKKAKKKAKKIWVRPGPWEHHTRNNGRVQIRFSLIEAAAPGPGSGLVEAVLMESGSAPRKHSEAVVFARDLGKTPLPVQDDVIELYRQQLTEGQKELLGPDGVLSSPNDWYPVFYLLDEEGDVLFFGHTMTMRLPYPHAVRDYVPEALREGEGQVDVDMAQAIFGYTRSWGEGKTRSYAGRVFVGDATLDADQEDFWWVREPITPRILSGPKPTTFQHYLVQEQPDKVSTGGGRARRTLSTYSAPLSDTVLRGYKLYWHKNGEVTREQVEETESIADTVKDTQHTRMKPVSPNVRFSFDVRFENLAKEELGALLWAMVLPGAEGREYRHKLGMGKAYGLGTVHVEVQELLLENRKERYAALFDGQDGTLTWHTGQKQMAAGEARDDFVTAFERYVLRESGETGHQRLAEAPRMRALLKLLEWPGPANAKTQYMGFQEFRERERAVLPDPLYVAGERDRSQRRRGPSGGGPRPSSPSRGPSQPDRRPADRQDRPTRSASPAETDRSTSSEWAQKALAIVQGETTARSEEGAEETLSVVASGPTKLTSADELRPGLYVQGTVAEVQHNGLEVDLGVATVWLARENINPRNLSADELAERFPEGTIMRGWMLAPNKKGRQRMSQWEPKGGAGSGA